MAIEHSGGQARSSDSGSPLAAKMNIQRIISLAVASAFLITSAAAQTGTVLWHQKISDTEGGFTGILPDLEFLGWSVAPMGDHDGDGVDDLAVGALWDSDGGFRRGALWIMFLNSDGTVKSHQKISDTEGGFTGVLDNIDWFGNGLASLGDLDGDGVGDLAVGAFKDDDGGPDRGAIWVLFLNADGTVKSHQKISDTEGGFRGALDDNDRFGVSLAPLGDLNGDGVVDLAAGAANDGDGGAFRGAVWVLFLNANGTVMGYKKISDTQGGFSGILDDGDKFGRSVDSVGDLNGDGVGDLAVGAVGDGDGGFERGAVWVLFLNSNGRVKSHQKISQTEGGFSGILDDEDDLGTSVASMGDLNGDGVGDIAVGTAYDDDGGDARGAVWMLFLNSDGTVKSQQKISDTEGSFTGVLDDGDRFGMSVASAGDLDGDGQNELAVGANRDDDGGSDRGAVWVLFLNGSTPQPGITVTPTDGLVTTEEGGSDEFSVVLKTQPTADVSFGLSSSDLSEGTVSTSSLTFTPANWNVPQQVTVTGVDDAVVDGPVAYFVDLAPVVSADADYNGLNTVGVTVTNQDDDTGVTVDSISPSSMDAGTSVSVTISGSGFAEGAIVDLGGRKAPAVSSLVVVNSFTITLTLTYDGRPPKNAKVFDVRVTNLDETTGVLAGGFTLNGR
jgi:hypothetical protein